MGIGCKNGSSNKNGELAKMITMVLLTAKDKVAETKGADEKSVTINHEKAAKVCQHMMWLPKVLAALKQKNNKRTSIVST